MICFVYLLVYIEILSFNCHNKKIHGFKQVDSYEDGLGNHYESFVSWDEVQIKHWETKRAPSSENISVNVKKRLKFPNNSRQVNNTI